MQIPLDISKIQIPKNPDREWIWLRVLLQVEYSRLNPVNALQWAILTVLTEFSDDLPPINDFALKLGMEIRHIDEGLLNLTTQNVLQLKRHQNPRELQNYVFPDEIKNVFKTNDAIQESPVTQKFILFHDLSENTYYYQIVERMQVSKKNGLKTKSIKPLNFDNLMLAVIEQIWDDLENDPHSLTGEKALIIKNHSLLSNPDYLVLKILINFL